MSMSPQLCHQVEITGLELLGGKAQNEDDAESSFDSYAVDSHVVIERLTSLQEKTSNNVRIMMNDSFSSIGGEDPCFPIEIVPALLQGSSEDSYSDDSLSFVLPTTSRRLSVGSYANDSIARYQHQKSNTVNRRTSLGGSANESLDFGYGRPRSSVASDFDSIARYQYKNCNVNRRGSLGSNVSADSVKSYANDSIARYQAKKSASNRRSSLDSCMTTDSEYGNKSGLFRKSYANRANNRRSSLANHSIDSNASSSILNDSSKLASADRLFSDFAHGSTASFGHKSFTDSEYSNKSGLSRKSYANRANNRGSSLANHSIDSNASSSILNDSSKLAADRLFSDFAHGSIASFGHKSFRRAESCPLSPMTSPMRRTSRAA
jgi:hypothetical protein